MLSKFSILWEGNTPLHDCGSQGQKERKEYNEHCYKRQTPI